MTIATTTIRRTLRRVLVIGRLSLIFLLPLIFFSCKEALGPVPATSENSATIEGIVYGKQGTAEKEPLSGALVSIENAFMRLDTLTDAYGGFHFVIVFPDSDSRATTTSIEVSKTPLYDLQSEQVIIRPGSEVVANFTLISVDTLTPPRSSGSAATMAFISASSTFANIKDGGPVDNIKLIFEVRDSSGIPVDSFNLVKVKFRIVPTTGGGVYLSSDSTYTEYRPGSYGRASTVLHAGTRAGIIQVEAVVDSPRAIRTTSPAIPIYGGPPNASHFTLTAEKSNFPALGVNNLENKITVQVGDKWSNPVRVGTPVQFSSTAGVIQSASTTSPDGKATAILSSGDPHPFSNGVAFVYAETVGDSGKIVRDSIRVLLTGAARVFPADTTFIVPDGSIVTLPFRVSDQNGNPLSKGTRILVSLNGDATSELVTSGDLDVVLLDTQEKAATLYAVTIQDTAVQNISADKNLTMTVRVSGANGDVVKTYPGVLRGSGTTGGTGAVEKPASIVMLSVNPNEISVQGTGSNESAILTFAVRDRNGRALPQDSATVEFQLQGNEIGATLYPLTAKTDAQGRVQTTISSGTKAGVVQVVASTDTGGGVRVTSTPVPVTIAGGLPDNKHFTIAVEKLNIPGMLKAGLTDNITVYVGDRYGNPVQPGTGVYFTTDGGLIKPAAFTNAGGIASVVLTSADPQPSSGQVTITATTISDSGITIPAVARVIFSGPPLIGPEVESIALRDGGSTILRFNVTDLKGNPLSAGSTVNVSIAGPSAGEVKINGDLSTTLGDHFFGGPGVTNFAIGIADTVENSILEGYSVIYIDVAGPNGALRVGVPLTLLPNDNPSLSLIKIVALTSITSSRITVRGTGEADSTQLFYEIQDTLGRPIRLTNVPVNFDLSGASGTFTPSRSFTDSLGRVSTTFFSSSDTGTALVRAQVGDVKSREQAVLIMPGKPSLRYFSLSLTKPGDSTLSVNYPGGVSGLQQKVGVARIQVKDRYGNPVAAGTQVALSSNAGSVQDVGFTNKAGQINADWFGGSPLPPGGIARVIASVTGEGEVVIKDTLEVTYSGNPVIAGGLPQALALRNLVDTAVTFSVADANGNPLAKGTTIKVVASGAGSKALILTGDVNVTLPDTRTIGAGTTNFTFRMQDSNTVVTTSQVLSVSIQVDGPNTKAEKTSVDTIKGAAPPPFKIIALAGITSTRLSVTGTGLTDSTRLEYELQDSAGHALMTPNVDVAFNFNGVSGRFVPERAATDSRGRVSTTFFTGTAAETVKVRALARGISSSSQDILVEAGSPASELFALSLLGTSDGQPKTNFAGAITTSRQIGEARVQVRDKYGNTVKQGTQIIFSSDAGAIQAFSYTDKDGVARVPWYSGVPYPENGVATVKAEVKDGVGNVLASRSLSVSYSGDPIIGGGIPADFILRQKIDTIITYSVLDATGNPMAQGTTIRVVANGPGSSTLVLSGDLTTTMSDTRDASAGQFAFRILDTNNIFTSNRNVSFSIQVSGSNGSAAKSSAGYLKGVRVASVAAIGLSAISTTKLTVKDAGGTETALLTYQILDSLSNPIRKDSIMVLFSSEGVPGSFSPESVMTDAEGKVQTLFRSGTVAGVVRLIARVNGTPIMSPNMKIAVVGGLPAQDYFTFILSRSEEGSQKVNYPGAIPLVQKIGEAQVQTGDRYGNPVPEGTPIYFTTSAGVIQGTAFTNSNGFAKVDWFGGNPVPVTGTGVVKASALGANAVTVIDSAVVTYSGSPLITEATASDFKIPGGGTLPFSFKVADSRGNPLAEGTRIQVVTRGTGAASITMTGDVDVTMPDTRSTGATSFAFTVRDTSTFSKTTRDLQVALQVSGPNGSATQTIIGSILPSGSGRTRLPGSIALISTSTNDLKVTGTGGVETSTMVFELRDSLGVPVDSNYVVRFSLAPSLGGAFISPDSGSCDPRTGRINAVIHSGTISGTIQVVATVSTPNGDISSTPVRQLIHAGQPDQAHLSIGTSRLNLPGLAINGDTASITAIVGDRHGNPVPVGTAVHFSTSLGLVTTASGFTDVNGMATATLFTANPRPADGFGYVKVTSMGVGGTVVEDSIRILFSGPPIIDSIEFVPGNITNFTVKFRVYDLNRNPLCLGSGIDVGAEGNVSLNVSNVIPQAKLPDTQDPSWTYYAANFTIDLEDTPLKLGKFTGRISVTGPSGTAVQAFEGVVDTVAAPPANVYGITLLQAKSSVITVRDAGGQSSSLLVYGLQDEFGRAVPQAGVKVIFRNQGAPGSFVPETTETDAVGNVYTTFSSDTLAGTATIYATIPDSGITSTALKIAITGGRPSQRYFTVALTNWASGPKNVSDQLAPRQNFPGAYLQTVSLGQARVMVGDKYGNPPPSGTPVYFTTNAGVIVGSDTTDLHGVAVANWGSGNPLPPGGIAVITASTRGENDLLVLDSASAVYSGQSMISGGLPENFVLGAGFDTTLAYKVSDVNGNPISQGMTLLISVTGPDADLVEVYGEPLFETFDTRDTFYTHYVFQIRDRAPNVSRDRRITVTLQVFGSGIEDAGPNGRATHSVSGTVVNSTAVPAGLALINSTNPQISVRGTGGTETTVLTYEAKDNVGNTVRIAGIPVTFLQNGTRGSFAPETAWTGTDGRVKVTFRSDTLSGVAQVAAKLITQSVTTSYESIVIVGGRPDAGHFTFVLERFKVAGNKVNFPGAISLVQQIGTAKVQAGDRYGNPVPAGTPIYFTTNAGVIQGIGYADASGFASADWFGGNPIPPGDSAIVKASAVGMDNITVLDSNVVTYSGDATIIEGIPNGFQISGGGTATFTYRVGDSHGNPLASGSTIKVSAGGVGAGFVVLSGDVDITMPDTRDTAATRFTFAVQDTGLNSVSEKSLQLFLEVDGPNGSASQASNGTILAKGRDTTRSRLPGSVAFLSLSKNSIQVIGTGGTETASLTYEIRDSVGIPVDSSYRVRFTLSNAIGGAFISPDSGLSDPVTGQITAVVHSGTVSGAIDVVATVVSQSGTISSSAVRILIHAALPDQEHFSIMAEPSNLPGLAFNGRTSKITAIVGDRYSNPVPANTAVYFSSTLGIISTSQGFTDANGFAEGTLFTGNPRGDALGYGYARASTIGEGGVIVTDSTRMLFSGAPIIINTGPTTFSTIIGGCATLTFRVEDEHGNPIVSGSRISLRVTSESDFTTSEAIVMPDVIYPGPGRTEFTMQVCDVDEEPAVGASATVTVIVEWEGQTYSLEIATGTLGY